MHKPSIAQAVYEATFPRPKPSDPTSFAVHIARNLVPEVRLETAAFYGLLDSVEAQYPGLDYSYGPHRARLSRFPWHRRLFRVFDELRLTKAEIASLCRWEGTLSARERYEREEGVVVRDTTADSIRPATPRPRPAARFHNTETELSAPATGSATPAEFALDGVPVMAAPGENADEAGDFSDEEMESYGVQLNQRLIYATAARERGHNIPLDEDWEQWLKEARERGSYDMMDVVRTGQPLETRSNTSTSSSISVPLIDQMDTTARRSVTVPSIRLVPNDSLHRSPSNVSGFDR